MAAFLFDIKRLRKELAPRLTCEPKPKENTGVDTELWEEAREQLVQRARGSSMAVH